MAFRILSLAVLAAVALNTPVFAATTTKKTTTTTTTTQSASKPAATPAAKPAPKPAPKPVETYTVSSSSSKTMNVGLLAGMSAFNNGGGTKFTAGAQFNYTVMPMFTIGAEFQMPFVGSGVTTWVGLADFWYNIEQVDGLHVGAKAGIVSSSATGSPSTSNFAFGPAAGYDYWMNSDWTVGGEVDYIMDTATVSTKMFQFFAGAKYWF